MASTETFAGILALTNQIKECEQSGQVLAALTLSFVCIDTMAYLGLPSGKTSQTRSDFIAWVDKYLKAHHEQQYQYRGTDVYAARCGFLHAFSAEADLHRKDQSIYLFGYHDGGELRCQDDAKMPDGSIRKFAMIGTKSLTNDLQLAVMAFMETMISDAELRANAVARLRMVYQVMPMPTVGEEV